MRIRYPVPGSLYSAWLHLYVVVALLAVSGCTETVVVPPNLLDPNSSPAFVTSYPPPGGMGPFSGIADPFSNASSPLIYLQFNKAMDPATFLTGSVRVTGGGTSFRVLKYDGRNYGTPASLSDVIALTVVDSNEGALYYHVGTTYTVTIDTTVTDFEGHHLLHPVVFAFTPEPKLRVVRVEPQNGESVTPYELELPTVYFNSYISASESTFFHLSHPPPDGQWMVTEYFYGENPPTSFTFSSQALYPAGSSHTITVDKGLKDIYGNVLGSTFSSTFTVVATTGLSIEEAYPDSNSLDEIILEPIELGFSSPIDTTTAAKGIVITPPVTSVRWVYNNTIYTGDTWGLIPDTTYTVTVTKHLKSTNGSSLANPLTFTFKTGPFTVYYYEPHTSAYGTFRNSLIHVEFTGDPDSSSVAGAFSMTPPTSGHFIYTNDNYSFDFVPDSLLAPNTRYEVTVSTALRAIGSYPLNHPLDFVFTTGDQ